MAYKLGKRSLQRLEGVDERLVTVVKAAISRSSQDFSVLEGLRSMDRQRELVKKGHSQTMKSKHISGLAVDLGAYDPVTGIRWEEAAYFPIADAMQDAARECGISLCWGARNVDQNKLNKFNRSGSPRPIDRYLYSSKSNSSDTAE